jgi:hypothetical protein
MNVIRDREEWKERVVQRKYVKKWNCSREYGKR